MSAEVYANTDNEVFIKMDKETAIYVWLEIVGALQLLQKHGILRLTDGPNLREIEDKLSKLHLLMLPGTRGGGT